MIGRSGASTALCGAAIAVLTALPAAASGQAIRASERGLVRQEISGTVIEIDYSRPSLRGRDELFGGQIFWGEVWTPGANRATVLRLSEAVTVNGVELEAGAYSLWIEVLENDPWTLVVHPDTLRSHGNHPLVEEGVIAVEVEQAESPVFVETLSFDVQRIRPTSAVVEMTWGHTRVTFDLGIDPGFQVVVSPEVGRAMSGEWSYDDSAQLPSDEQVEGWMSNPEMTDEQKASFQGYLDAQRAIPRPRPIRLEYDPETGYLTLVDPIESEAMGSAMEGADVWGTILIPRGEGMFMLAGVMNGELAAFNPQFARLVEVEFDEEGRPTAFGVRGRDDELIATAERGG